MHGNGWYANETHYNQLTLKINVVVILEIIEMLDPSCNVIRKYINYDPK